MCPFCLVLSLLSSLPLFFFSAAPISFENSGEKFKEMMRLALPPRGVNEERERGEWSEENSPATEAAMAPCSSPGF